MGDELSLLPETRPDDVEDVVWGLQTATTLWGRGEKREALVWLRRAAEAAGSAGADVRAVELAKRAIELETLFQLQGPPPSTAPSAQVPLPPAALPSNPPQTPSPGASKPSLPKPPPLAELIEPDELLDEETQERTLPGLPQIASSPPPGPPAPLPAAGAPPVRPPTHPPVSATAATQPAQHMAPPQRHPTPPPISFEQPALPLNKTQPIPIVQHPLAATQASASPQGAPTPTPPMAEAQARAPEAPAPAVSFPSPPSAAPAAPSAPQPHTPQPHTPQPQAPQPQAPQPQAPQPEASPPAPAAAAQTAVSATPAPASVALPPPAGSVITSASARAAAKKRQRAPILDPWSDDIPDEPAPRTIGHRTDNFSDEDVITSAPSIDAMLKRKAPPPPPPPPAVKRTATLTGGPDGQPTLDAAKSKLANLADDAPRPQPPPPPTRKPTLAPGAPNSADPRKSIPPTDGERPSVPPPPLDGAPARKSVPPPPPPRRTTPPPGAMPPPAGAMPPPAGAGGVAPTNPPITPPPASVAHPQPSVAQPPSLGQAPPPALFGEGLPPASVARPAQPAQPAPVPAAPTKPGAEHKTDPPPATMPAAQVARTAAAAAAAAPVPAPAPTRPSAAPPPPAPRPPSAPPPAPRPPSAPPAPAPPAPAPAPAPPASAPRPPTVPPPDRSVGGLVLDKVEGFADLPGEVQADLAKSARVVELGVDEEVSGFGIALLLSGSAVVCATIADVAAVALAEAALAPAFTAYADSPSVRVVATAPSRVAVWDRERIEDALKSCPWVMDDLTSRGDRVAALAGATMGPLGDLDESSRFMALENLTVRALTPGEVLVAASGDVAGLTIVGLGSIIQGEGEATYSSGDVVLAGSVLEGGAAPAEIKAGPQGALVLVATRMKTLELFSTIPSLIELLRVS